MSMSSEASQDRDEHIASDTLQIIAYLDRSERYIPETENNILKAIQHALTVNRRDFPQNPVFFSESCPTLLSYVVRFMSSESCSPSDASLSDAISILTELISLCQGKTRPEFLRQLLRAITIAQNEGRVVLPCLSDCEPLEDCTCPVMMVLVTYMRLLESYLTHFLSNDFFVLEVLANILKGSSDEAMYWAVRCLAAFHPVSCGMGRNVIMLTLSFASTYFSEMCESYSDLDSFLHLCFNNSIRVIPSSVKLLMVRDLLGWMGSLSSLQGSMLINDILTLVQWFVKFERHNALLVGSFFVRVFPCFAKNKEFIFICKGIGQKNSMFSESIFQRYSDDPATFLARLVISPKIVKPTETFDLRDAPLLYDIVCDLDTVSNELGDILRESLKETPPEPHQVGKLISYLHRVYYFAYPDDVLTEIALHDEVFFLEEFERLVRRALQRRSVPLAAFLITKNPSQTTSLDDIIIERSQRDHTVWQIPNYPSAFRICQQRSKVEFPSDLYQRMYKNRCPQLFLSVANEEALWLPFLKQICGGMASDSVIETDTAFAVLKRVDNFLDMFVSYPFFFSDFMLKIHIKQKEQGYPMFRLIGEQFLEHYLDIRGGDNHQKRVLKGLEQWIVPTLVANENLEDLRYFVSNTVSVPHNSNVDQVLRDVLLRLASDITLYVILFTRGAQRAGGFEFFELHTQKKLSNAIYWDVLWVKLALFLGHPSPTVQKNVQSTLSGVCELIVKDNTSAEDLVQKEWRNRFLPVSLDYVQILGQKESPLRKFVVRSLINSAKYIACLLDKYSSKIMYLLELIIKDDSLRKGGIDFWTAMLKEIQDKTCLGSIAVPLIALLLPYFDEYPNEIAKIFTNLIVANQDQEWTDNCLSKIAFIPIFSERKELAEINACLRRYRKENCQMSWCEQLLNLGGELENASTAYRRLLLEHILSTLKSNITKRTEFSAAEASSLWLQVWGSLLHEKVQENLVLFGRCMACMPFVGDAGPPEFKPIDQNDHNALMRTLIQDFLVKRLEDSSSYQHHDRAALAIQLLLEKLGCRTQAPEGPQDNENWNLLPQAVQSQIYPFLSSRYRKVEITDKVSAESSKTSEVTDFHMWISSFTLTIMKASMENPDAPDFVQCCVSAIPDSTALCVFLLPYLCVYNLKEKKVTTFLKREWAIIMGRLRKENAHGFPRQAMQVMFSLFDRLNSWKISAGEMQRRPTWTALRIASEEQLMEAAKKCEMYLRALMHLEFYIRDHKLPWTDKRAELLELYEHLDDHDTLEALRAKSNADSDQTAILAESKALSSGSSLNDEMTLLNSLLRTGRYERALSDACNIRMKLVSNPAIDAVIANAAIRLLKWDDMNKGRLGNRDSGQTGIDMSMARILYHHHFKEENLFNAEVAKVKDALVSPLVTSSVTSYAQMMPILAQYGIIEEIVDSYGSNRLTFTNWESDIPFKHSDIERIVAARCALIDTCYDNEQEKRSQITSQWLQLAHQCRKSGLIEQSNVFCMRARTFAHLSDDIDRCRLETALNYWDMNQNDLAMSILNTIETKESRLQGKVKFLKARWSEELHSAESHTIMEYYVQAAEQLGNSGKAFFAMANLADKRIMQMLQANEQINQDNKPGITRNSRGVSKFLGTPSPTSIATFLNEQMEICIKNYLKSLILSPQYAHEVVCRILYIMFDLGKHLVYEKTDPYIDSKNPFSVISQNQRKILSNTMIESFKDNVNDIKSGIWLNFVTQLISRIEQPKPLDEYLFMLIESALVSYPDATLWHLMSMHNSLSENRPKKFEEFWAYCSQNFTNVNQVRFYELRKKFLNITTHLINLSQSEFPRTRSATTHSSPPDLLNYFNSCNLMMPLASTLNLPTGSMLFENPQESLSLPRITSMKEHMLVLTSQQLPKKITLVSNRGTSYGYLVKKDDDLRKDMRMMEFATFMNRLLNKDRKCRQRNLGIITFAVVCLNEKCGIIEWVEHTCGFRSIVEDMIKEDNKGLSTAKIRELMLEGHRNDRCVREQKYLNFINEILPAYPPMMHLWLVSKFNSTFSRWFQARLNYTRSVAVWSMIGYVLGLGDRHAENILINEKTGSCLHVDFCCLFDKAKTLQVPEIVPFRLTQNIVDGMGVLKTEGLFRTSARIVMETMRAKKQKVISVWNSCASDPLLEWNSGGQAGPEIQAKRTLEGIDNRLSGRGEDLSTVHSPELLVNELIERATDPHLLSQMFIGWQAYL